MWPDDIDALIALQDSLAAAPGPGFFFDPTAPVGACYVCFARGGTGSGAAGEKLIDYALQKKAGTSWENIVSVTGNAQKTVYHRMVPPLSTDGLRLQVFKADNNPADWYARVAEIFVFAAMPRGGTVILIQ